MKTVTTIEQLSKNLTEFHDYVLVPFNKTSMTIPRILYYAIATKYENPRAYFKETATRIKQDILNTGVSKTALQGKLSRKVQEIAWCEIIHKAKASDVDLVDFQSSQVIPYADTTMTVPMFLFNLIKSRNGDVKKNAIKYIREKAEELKAQIMEETDLSQSELKGKISHKIQENLWLEFIPEKIKNTPIELVA